LPGKLRVLSGTLVQYLLVCAREICYCRSFSYTCR